LNHERAICEGTMRKNRGDVKRQIHDAIKVNDVTY
jgi:hypothetical protein